eukprot:3190049-Pyramimonas_sp.AAC.1
MHSCTLLSRGGSASRCSGEGGWFLARSSKLSGPRGPPSSPRPDAATNNYWCAWTIGGIWGPIWS